MSSASRSVATLGKDLLRFMTCGSVDDGKSTLIGRLLYDLGQVYADQLVALESDSKKFGTTCNDLDYALLVDGLQAEREQGITIDVAFRFFASPKRKYIVADTPGHEQYTRNMVTGASVSDLAVVLVDARKGVIAQTRRHSAIAHLLDVRHIVLAVNKMDLVDFDMARYFSIQSEYAIFAKEIGITTFTCIPVASRTGDNIVRRAEGMPWYSGPTMIEHLESVDVTLNAATAGMVLPVQWVNRPHLDFRGVSGTLSAGVARLGDPVVVLPSGRTTRLKAIETFDGSLSEARGGDTVTLLFEDEVDASRGDVIASDANRPEMADQFAAHIIWLGDEPMLPGRPYLLKCSTQTVSASITKLKHKVVVESLTQVFGRQLRVNEIAECNLATAKPIVFAAYEQNRQLGAFILIDKFTNQTVGAGMIRVGLRRGSQLHKQAFDVNRAARARQKGQRPLCLWFTGLSGSGKSTIANALDRRLYEMGHHAYILDGDNVRLGLNNDLGFTEADRIENIRRVAQVAKLMVDAGLIVIVSFISPFRNERQMARDLFHDNEFLEVFIDTPIDVCEARDVKGLYKRARSGQLNNFTGIDSAYEVPERPDVRLDGRASDITTLVDQLLSQMQHCFTI